jgi:hypothetical protein
MKLKISFMTKPQIQNSRYTLTLSEGIEELHRKHLEKIIRIVNPGGIIFSLDKALSLLETDRSYDENIDHIFSFWFFKLTNEYQFNLNPFIKESAKFNDLKSSADKLRLILNNLSSSNIKYQPISLIQDIRHLIKMLQDESIMLEEERIKKQKKPLSG